MINLIYNEDEIVELIYYEQLPEELEAKPHMQIEVLAEAEEKKGYIPILKCNGEKYWYEYVEKQLTEEEKLIESLKEEIRKTNKSQEEIMLAITEIYESQLK